MMTKEIALAVLDAQKAVRQADKAYSEAVVAQTNAMTALHDAVDTLRAAVAADNITDDFAYTLSATQLAIVRIQRPGVVSVIKVDVRT